MIIKSRKQDEAQDWNLACIPLLVDSSPYLPFHLVSPFIFSLSALLLLTLLYILINENIRISNRERVGFLARERFDDLDEKEMDEGLG